MLSGVELGAWYALKVRPLKEKHVAWMLRAKGYEEFLPLYKERRRWSDRFRDIEVPLFPGYVFCRFEPEARLPVLTTPGVSYIISSGRDLLPVPNIEITALQSVIVNGLHPEPHPYLQTGQHVEITSGPLKGVVGILVAVKRSVRVVLSITLLQRSVGVEVDRDWIREVHPQPQRRPEMMCQRVEPMRVVKRA